MGNPARSIPPYLWQKLLCSFCAEFVRVGGSSSGLPSRLGQACELLVLRPMGAATDFVQSLDVGTPPTPQSCSFAVFGAVPAEIHPTAAAGPWPPWMRAESCGAIMVCLKLDLF